MAGLDKETPILTSHHIKELYPDICQLMLVNNNANLSYLLRSEKEISESIERVFVWNGSTKVFLAMAKYLEDKKMCIRDSISRLGSKAPAPISPAALPVPGSKHPIIADDNHSPRKKV